jgi:hypothetical protein
MYIDFNSCLNIGSHSLQAFYLKNLILVIIVSDKYRERKKPKQTKPRQKARKYGTAK